MKYLRKIALLIMLLMFSSMAVAESNYDVSELYTVIKPASGTKAVGKYDKTMDVEYILTPTKVDIGKYVVEVTKIGDNLYQIKNGCLPFQPFGDTLHVVLARDDCRMAVGGCEACTFVAYAKIYISYVMYRK